MKKRIISLLTAAILIVASCFITTAVYADNTVDSTLTLNAQESTAKKLVFSGTDTIDINSSIKKFKATAENEGIIVNSTINKDLAFVKRNGTWIINFSKNVAADTVVTVKGTFTYDSYSVKFDTISVKYNGSAWVVTDTPATDNTEYNRTFDLHYADDINKYGTVNGFFLLGNDTLECDTSWGTLISFDEGDNNGVFINGAKTATQMKKITPFVWYVCLSDAGVTPVKDDVVTVKGAITHNGKTAVYQQISVVFDGTTWDVKTEVEEGTFKQYYISDTERFGNEKGIYLESNDSMEHDANWNTFISFDAGDNNGVFLNGVKTSVKMKKFAKDYWYVCLQDSNISAKTGDNVTVKGTVTHKNKKVCFAEISLVFDGVTWSLTDDPNLETGRTLYLDEQLPDPQNGISLIGDDGLAKLGWEQRIYAYTGEQNGVFLNGTRTEVHLKKYDTKKWYVCLSDAGITAKKNDVVTIKGIFSYKDFRIAFNEVEFTFDGTNWTEKVDTQTIELDFVDLLTISKFNTETGKWEIYLSTTKALPGVDDAVFFDVLMKVDGKSKTIKCKKSSQQHSFAFEIDSALIPQNPKAEVSLKIMGGNYAAEGENAKIKLTGETILYFANGDVSFTSSNVAINEKDIEITIDRTSLGGGNELGIFLVANDNVPYDVDWSVATTAYEGKTNGIFLNGVKTDVFLKKFDTNNYYVCLSDANVLPKNGDIVTIKGIFKTGSYISSYKQYNLVFKDGSWVDGTEPETNYTTVTITGFDSKVSRYSNDSDRWELYFTTKEKLPGNADQRFDSVNMTINGVSYFMPCYHAGHEDEFFLIIESDKIAKNGKAEVKVSGKAKSADQLIGMDVKEFTIYINQYGVSLTGFASEIKAKESNVKLSLDTTTFSWMAGTESGIYLITSDNFAVDKKWSTPIRAVSYDENSGIFYNGKKIDASLKKYDDGHIYLDISSGGVFAKDKDKITVKGLFALGNYGVSYSELTLYYNGQSWATTYTSPRPKTTVKLTPVGISASSGYNKNSKAWDIYIKFDADVPGYHNYEYKTLICEVNGKTLELSGYKVNNTLVFSVPSSVLPENAPDGASVTLKAGVANDRFGIYSIDFTKDITAYFHHKKISDKAPTTNTKFLDITVPGLLRTGDFSEDVKGWQLFFVVEEELDVDEGAEYYDIGIKVNGKAYEEICMYRSEKYLYVYIPESVLPKDAKTATLTIDKGAKAIANSGWNGIRFNDEVNAYLFGGVWNNVKFTDYEYSDLKMQHLSSSYYNSTISRWDIYVNVDKEIPGSNWFEKFEGLTAYLNGKEFTTYANKAESGNNRLFYISLDEALFGKFKEGDIVTFPAGLTMSCGGYKINSMQEFSLQFVNGTWFEYYETDVKAPEAMTSFWENSRIDGYIPVQEDRGFMFSNVEPINVIKSVEDMKDVTFKFSTTKMLAFNEELPTNSIVLRGQPLTEGMAVSETALYGYNVAFAYIELTEERVPNNPELVGVHSQEISIWKNGINYSLIDQYRLTYNWNKTNHPFFEYDKTYDYTISIYNATEDVCIIEIYCNNELIMRVVDRASDDPMDPVRNAGEFQIYASCPQYFNAPAVELDALEVSKSECFVGDQVRVSATYPAVLEGSEYTVDSEDATIKNGVFIAKKPGTYTVTGSYNGKSKGTVQIKVSEKAVQSIKTEKESEFPILPVAIGGGAVLAVVAAVVILVIIKKKKSKTITQ